MKKGIKIFAGVLAGIILVLCVFLVARDIYGSGNRVLHVAMPIAKWGDVPQTQMFEYLNTCKLSYKQKTGVDVSISLIPEEEYSEWLSAQMLAGTAPDIMGVLPKDFETFYSANAILDLSNGGFDQHIQSNVLEPWRREGNIYGVPFQTDPFCIVVNESMLQDENMNFNLGFFDWMDLYYLCSKFTYDSDNDGQNDMFGVSGITWRHLVYANGQKLFDFDKTQAYFDNKSVRFALDYAVSINRLNLESQADAFETGHAVAKVATLSQARYYLDTMQGDLTVISFPKGPDGELYAEPYDLPLCIFSGSEHKGDALAFLQYLCLDEQNQEMLFDMSYGYPVLKTAQQSSHIQEKMEEKFVPGHLDVMLGMKPVDVQFLDYYNLMDMADMEIFQFIRADVDVRKTLSSINNRIVSSLEQFINQNGDIT